MRETSPGSMTDDLNKVTSAANELMDDTAHDLSETTQQIREKLAHTLETAKELYGKLSEQTVAGAKATDKCIREHPYQSLGIAFGAGLLIGFLITRRD